MLFGEKNKDKTELLVKFFFLIEFLLICVFKSIIEKMATRSRASDGLSQTAPDAASTPRHRTQSPTRHSRISEKLELQSLNDRLAGYIDRVRFLESENNRLTVEVKTVRETVTRESSNIKSVIIFLNANYLQMFIIRFIN